jgi:hypothetical protein
MSHFRDFFDFITGRASRREEREAYMAALSAVVSASMAQTELFRSWLDSFKQASGEPQKGWTQTDREQVIDEILSERPYLKEKMPLGVEGDYAAMEEWLNNEIMHI